jgi:hypothetical protein
MRCRAAGCGLQLKHRNALLGEPAGPATPNQPPSIPRTVPSSAAEWVPPSRAPSACSASVKILLYTAHPPPVEHPTCHVPDASHAPHGRVVHIIRYCESLSFSLTSREHDPRQLRVPCIAHHKHTRDLHTTALCTRHSRNSITANCLGPTTAPRVQCLK